MLQGVDRSSLLASEWANNNVNLEIVNESTIKVSSNASQIGKISETQQIDVIQGEKQFNISFDGRFMLDALRAIKEETVTLSFSGSMRPILVEAGTHSAKNPSYISSKSLLKTEEGITLCTSTLYVL